MVTELLVAVDPAVERQALAVYVRGELHGLVRILAGAADGGALLEECRPYLVPVTADRRAVIELPQVYPGRRQKGDPNDLIEVAAAAGAVGALLSAHGLAVRFVRPRDWKGQRPKDVDHARTRAILHASELEIVERVCAGVPRAHRLDLMDAVGIGLWSLGRGREST